jgi:peptide/nickel transport system permease protein
VSQLAADAARAPARLATSIRGLRVPILVVLAFVFVAAVAVAALVGTHLGFQSPGAIDPLSVAARPNGHHRFGTDELGRDVLARVVAGAQSALVGPLVIALSGFVFSGLIGIGAGYIGGLVDSIVMRIVDFMFALPGLLIAIVIVTIVQGGYWVAVIVLAVLNVQGDIRLVRGATLAQRSLAYVEAERVSGIPTWRIMYKHIGRNILPILLADLAIDFGSALVALAGLAFLGLGAQPGTPDWGLMLTQGQAVLFENPYAALAPGLAIVLLAMSVNLIGDWIYDRRSISVGSR